MLRKKYLLTASVIAVVTLPFVHSQLAYPTAWDAVQVGMTRLEVSALVGDPAESMGELKGDFWVSDNLTVRHSLQLNYSQNEVFSLYIYRSVGLGEHRQTFSVRAESQILEPGGLPQ